MGTAVVGAMFRAKPTFKDRASVATTYITEHKLEVIGVAALLGVIAAGATYLALRNSHR